MKRRATENGPSSIARAMTGSRLGIALYLASSLLGSPCMAVSMTVEPFGATADGLPVSRYTMATSHGVSVTFMSYGGTVTDIVTPDRHGRPAHIVLGFPTVREYEASARAELYFGALIGRYANFIAMGRFRLEGHDYQVPITDPPNSIHGGNKGFDKRIWTVERQPASGDSVSALLTYTSSDGEEGYPGTLSVSVTYTLSDDGAFAIHYAAVTDKPTVVNLTSHMNFNLAGAGSPGGVLGQLLFIDADRYTPTDRTQIPLGRLAPVESTPFDFRTPRAIGARIGDRNQQLAIANGYDQNWVLNKRTDTAQPQVAVRAYDPGSGRTLECLTTQPGVQVYTGNFFDGSFAGIGGRYRRHGAFTIETQHFPDSPNHPDFPSTELKPGTVFDSTTIYRFGVRS